MYETEKCVLLIYYVVSKSLKILYWLTYITTDSSHIRYGLGQRSVITWRNIHLGASTKLRKGDINFVMLCPSVCSHGATRLPLDGFSWNL